MKHDNLRDNLKDTILSKIRAHEVTMHSGLYFALKTAIVVIVAIGALILTIFLCNFIFFSIRMAGHTHFLRNGPSEFGLFIKMFPWPFLMFDIALLIFLQQLLKQFRFGYRVPVGYVFLILIVLAVSISLFLDQGVHFNDRLRERAHRHELPPPLNGWYERIPRLESGRPSPMFLRP